MSLAQSYSLSDVTRWYSMLDIQKAKAYLNSIDHIEVEEDVITALVKGTARQPYEVEIFFDENNAGNITVEPLCSCPVGFKCKHTAAVLLSALSLPRQQVAKVNHAVLTWLDTFQKSVTKPIKKKHTSVRPDCLVYTLLKSESSEHYVIRLYKSKLEAGVASLDKLEAWSNVEKALLKPPLFVTDVDLSLLRLLWRQRDKYEGFVLSSEYGTETLTRLLETERFCLSKSSDLEESLLKRAVALKRGEIREARLDWGANETGKMLPSIIREGSVVDVLPLQDATWYVDYLAGEIGLFKLAQSPAQVFQLLHMPPLSEVDAPVVAEALHSALPELPAPSMNRLRSIVADMSPVLLLDTVQVTWMPRYRNYSYGSHQKIDVARVKFRYGEALIPSSHQSEFVTLPNGETVRVTRDLKSESRYLNALKNYGLEEFPSFGYAGDKLERPIYALESESAWPIFMRESLARMKSSGWQVLVPPEFRYYLLEVEAWEAEFDEEENGWFSLNMGIVVNGQRLPLAPMLHELFKVDERWLDALQLAKMSDAESVELQLPEGGRVYVPVGRIKPLARTLIELFDGKPSSEIRLSRYDVARITELVGMERWQFKGADAVVNLAKRLKNTAGICAVPAPSGFTLELRPYQLEGVSWLQYLREQQLSGILADDMGLGKTAQALAHLLIEKQSGRMDKPSLVVLPTSLIFNWKREAERFAPQLKLLSLHGKERAEHFPSIPEHDVVLTTYPLLWRDEDALAEHEYHLLILDEAQTVKNVSSQAAQVVRKLKTRHRLCLTGTPLENHLGELWAQFDFLLPGFLGDTKSFGKTWRNPIEKQGNQARRDLLAQRIKPFILRRRKEDVAKELPAKTLIVRSVGLEGGQRDLYETVRIAMDQRVREEIAEKGFARSHIIILDALLKLRQVCCDPRLVKLSSAQKIKERAKLDLLMGMLPELVNERRRILVFSQFTSMLTLIEEDLAKEKLSYVKLTGDTQNREEVVRRFQDGEVPIFLISLKAGGVGLNLTAADTVIHYDPWWNPAVENQATDRAHRLGQTKNVFVYKLVVAGSIEEKILALQEKKAELAAGILSEDASGLVKFGEADIAALLAPLPNDE